MRTIKFRAWDKENNKFRSDDFLMSLDGEILDPKTFPFTIRKDVELMQFTGLKDKNGKEIYEGDIIDYDDNDNMLTDSGIYAVGWNDEVAGFGMMGIDLRDENMGISGYGTDDYCHHVVDYVLPKSKIIGNIYENKDLLK